jgi:hypothetical protein
MVSIGEVAAVAPERKSHCIVFEKLANWARKSRSYSFPVWREE